MFEVYKAETFAYSDEDHDGQLTFAQFKVAARSLGVVAKEEDFELLKKQCPMNFENFNKMMGEFKAKNLIVSEHETNLVVMKELRIAYDRMDTKRKGQLPLAALREIVTSMGDKVTNEEFDRIFLHSSRAKRDAHKNYQEKGLTFEQFYKLVVGKSGVGHKTK